MPVYFFIKNSNTFFYSRCDYFSASLGLRCQHRDSHSLLKTVPGIESSKLVLGGWKNLKNLQKENMRSDWRTWARLNLIKDHHQFSHRFKEIRCDNEKIKFPTRAFKSFPDRLSLAHYYNLHMNQPANRNKIDLQIRKQLS